MVKHGSFMKILNIFFIQILFFYSSIFSFIFFPDQKIDSNFFWHLEVLNLSKIAFQFENLGEGVRIAILDTVFYENQKSIDFYHKELFSLANKFKINPRLTGDVNISSGCKNIGDGQKNSLNLKFDCRFSGEFLKKNHGACIVSLIRQIAPNVEIISIPIFNDSGTTSLQNLVQGVKQALQYHVDILYLGLKIKDGDTKLMQKKEFLKLLKQIPYVIAPAGNDGLSCFEIAFPANSIFFSVGAFEQKNNQYLISDFSQKQIKNGPNFVMPGKNLGCFVWHEGTKKMRPCLVSGTSMAGACMVGCLAIILSENEQNFISEQIQYLLQKNSEILHQNQWDDFVNFGMINVEQCMFCIQQLKVIQNQMSKKKFIKKFKILVDKIHENFKSE